MHVVMHGSKVGKIRAWPYVRRVFGLAAARRGIEHFGWRSVVCEHAARGGQGRLARGRRCRARNLTMGAIAQVEPVTSVATRVCNGKGTDGDRQRLLRGFGSVRLALAGDDPRHVQLERHGVTRPPADGDPRLIVRPALARSRAASVASACWAASCLASPDRCGASPQSTSIRHASALSTRLARGARGPLFGSDKARSLVECRVRRSLVECGFTYS